MSNARPVFGFFATMFIVLAGLGLFLGLSIGVFIGAIPGGFGAAIGLTAAAVIWCCCSGSLLCGDAISIEHSSRIADCVYHHCPSCCHSIDLENAYTPGDIEQHFAKEGMSPPQVHSQRHNSSHDPRDSSHHARDSHPSYSDSEHGRLSRHPSTDHLLPHSQPPPRRTSSMH